MDESTIKYNRVQCKVEWLEQLVHCHIASNSGSPGVLRLHTVQSGMIPQHRPCIWLHSESCCVNIVRVINKQPHTERATGDGMSHSLTYPSRP